MRTITHLGRLEIRQVTIGPEGPQSTRVAVIDVAGNGRALFSCLLCDDLIRCGNDSEAIVIGLDHLDDNHETHTGVLELEATE